MTFRSTVSDTFDVNQSNDASRAEFDRFREAFFDGQMLEDQEFTAGQTRLIAHSLNRSARFFAVNIRAQTGATTNVTPYEDLGSTANRSLFLPVRADRAITCDLWIY